MMVIRGSRVQKPQEFLAVASYGALRDFPNLAPTGSVYSLQKVLGPAIASTAVRGSDASISRMLSQATFGPTRDEIASLKSLVQQANGKTAVERETTAFKQWIKDQIGMAPSLHRAYYRRRVNPRIFKGLVMPTGSSRAACASGSRWARYAFDESDRTKEIIANPILVGSGKRVFSLAIEGKIRTVVSAEEFGLGSIGVLNGTGPTRLGSAPINPEMANLYMSGLEEY